MEEENVKEIDFSQEEKPKIEQKTLRDRMRSASAKAKAKSEKAAADFKKFAFKGSIIDLAIAVIIGAAFGKIITSLVGDVVMPALGMLIGEIDFAALKIVLKKATIVDGVETVPETAIRYGAFIQTIFEFFIIAIAIFVTYKIIMSVKSRTMKKKPQTPPPPPSLTKTEQLLTDIKDLLKKEKGK